ncbi:hypothetical protein BC827DRAFT_814987 [Russula dissimulans]|nr:hypothetical protein BC827DRAFT_814987 [Russula dissimulans]
MSRPLRLICRMHWCPEPGCSYGSMQRSNLRNHVRRHTGQRLRCPDDTSCNYSTSDKSALLRHRQRKHGYQTKKTAPKDRRIKVTENRGAQPDKLDNQSIERPSNTMMKPVTDRRCPCSWPSTSNRRTSGAVDESATRQDDDHAPPSQATVIEPQVESIDSERPVEGHVTSRFPVSFARTRLPHATGNGGLSAPNSKHCRRCTCDSRTASDTASRFRRGVKVKEVVIYRRVSYLVKESVFLATC